MLLFAIMLFWKLLSALQVVKFERWKSCMLIHLDFFFVDLRVLTNECNREKLWSRSLGETNISSKRIVCTVNTLYNCVTQ